MQRPQETIASGISRAPARQNLIGADKADRTFPAQVRLLTGPEYARVLKAQKRVGDRYFVLHYIVSQHDTARLGLAISKKITRTGVLRNRLKRIARESFRLRRTQLPVVDVVVMARSGVVDADNAAMHDSLRKLWSRLVDACEKSSSC